MVKTGVLLIERGVAYHNTEETDLCTTRNMSTSDLLSVTLEELVINL